MNKLTIGSLIVIAAVAAGAVALDTSPPTRAQPAQLAPLPVADEIAHLPLALPGRQSLADERGLLFAAASWAQPQATPPASKQPAQQSASAGVSAVPVPYRFVGTVARGTEVEYVLAKGDLVFWVKQGETLDGVYRVEAMTADTVTLLYLPLEERTTLVLTTSHKSSLAADLGVQPPSTLPVAPQSSAPYASAPSAVPAMRAAQLRGPRNVPQ